MRSLLVPPSLSIPPSLYRSLHPREQTGLTRGCSGQTVAQQKAVAHSGGCGQSADVHPDTSEVSAVKSHRGLPCGICIFCSPKILERKKATCMLKTAAWFLSWISPDLVDFKLGGTGVQWEVLYSARVCPVWGCHQHMCCCHPVACILQIRAAIQSGRQVIHYSHLCLPRPETDL